MTTIKVSKLGSGVVETEVKTGESVSDVLSRLDITISKTDQIRFNNKNVSSADSLTESGTLVISQRVAGA